MPGQFFEDLTGHRRTSGYKWIVLLKAGRAIADLGDDVSQFNV